MANALKIRKFKEDELILAEGEISRTIYKLLSGKAAIYKNYKQSDEYLVGIISEKKCCGEVGLLTGSPELYSVVALTDVAALEVTEEGFDDFIQNNHSNIKDIMQNMARMITIQDTNIRMLTKEVEDAFGQDKRRKDEIMSKLQRYVRKTPDGLRYTKQIR